MSYYLLTLDNSPSHWPRLYIRGNWFSRKQFYWVNGYHHIWCHPSVWAGQNTNLGFFCDKKARVLLLTSFFLKVKLSNNGKSFYDVRIFKESVCKLKAVSKSLTNKYFVFLRRVEKRAKMLKLKLRLYRDQLGLAYK